MSGTTGRAAVLGAGSWGTALAVLLAGRGLRVTLWSRDPEHARRLAERRENEAYLPGVELPLAVEPVHDLPAALAGARLVVGAVPSAATPATAEAAAGSLVDGATWLSATKGLEEGTLRRMSEVVGAAAPNLEAVAVLSGPSFATEVAAGQPTAVVVACELLEVARRLQAALSGPTFRAYASSDVLGVELGGAVKNVIAIASGMLAGLGLGHDPTAALITRGLHEMTALAVSMGARPETLSGLAGLGDLVLTCTGGPSRNRRLGEAVARGATLDDAVAALGQVAEGVETTRRVLALAGRHGVTVPITAAVASVLFEGREVAVAVRQLMERDLKDEQA